MRETTILMNEFLEINERESGKFSTLNFDQAAPIPEPQKTLKMHEIFKEIQKKIGDKAIISPRRNQEHARISLDFSEKEKEKEKEDEEPLTDAQIQEMVVDILKTLGEPVEGPLRDSRYSGTYSFYKIPVKSETYPNGFDAPGEIEGDNIIIVDRTIRSGRLESGDVGQQNALNALRSILIKNGVDSNDIEAKSNTVGQRITDVTVNYKIRGKQKSTRIEVKSSSSSKGKDIAFFDKTIADPSIVSSLRKVSGKKAAALVAGYEDADALIKSILDSSASEEIKRLGLAAPSLKAQFSSEEFGSGRVGSEINKYINEEKFLQALRKHWNHSKDNIFAVDLQGDIVFFSTTNQEYTLPGTKEKFPPFTDECIIGGSVKLTSYGGTKSKGRIRVAFRASINPEKGRKMSTILNEWAMEKITVELLKEFIEK